MKRNIFLALFIIVCLSLCACSSDVSSVTTSSSTDMSTESMQTDIPVSEQTSDAQQPLTEPPVDPAKTAVSGVMSACFFDVGQADATLLMGPDFTILIDAGDYSNDDIVPYLNSAGVKDIDLIIGTHPHADHIGQFPQVFENFEVQEAWLSGDETTSRTFERALDAILDSDAEYCEPRAGETYEFGSLHIEVINPEHLTGELHEDCVSLRAVYGDVSFMFTGDAEVPTEMEILDRGYNLQAQILQLGHHGSSTSSCQEFLDAVQPEIAIYSAGQDNDYGHPHDETLATLREMGIAAIGTDSHGTITITGRKDGAFSVTTSDSDYEKGSESSEDSDTNVSVTCFIRAIEP